MLSRLVLVAGLLLPLAACNKKKNDGPSGLPGVPVEGTGGHDLKALRAERPLPPFTGIELALDAETVVSLGARHSVKVEAPDDLLPRIRAEVVGGRLVLGLNENENLAGLPKVRFTVIAEKVESVKAVFGHIQLSKMAGDSVSLEAGVSGTVTATDLTARNLAVKIGPGGTATVTGNIHAASVDANTTGTATLRGSYRQLGMKLGGSAKLIVNATILGLTGTIAGSSSLQASGELGSVAIGVEGSGSASLSGKFTTLRINLAGSGELTARGNATNLIAEVTSGSKLTADELEAETVSITASNGTESTVWATKTLTAVIDVGGGTIRYKGNPRIDRRMGMSGGQVLPLGKK